MKREKHNAKKRLKQWWQLSRGVVVFCLVLFLSHYLWKWLVIADPVGDSIGCLGFDWTPFFYHCSSLTAEAVAFVLRLLGMVVNVVDETTLVHDNGASLRIIWGCTGVKQLYIFALIMLTSRGEWTKKSCYFLMASCAIVLFNIARIACIFYYIKEDMGRFDALHELFRYLIYVFLFLLWIIWEENDYKRREQTVKKK